MGRLRKGKPLFLVVDLANNHAAAMAVVSAANGRPTPLKRAGGFKR